MGSPVVHFEIWGKNKKKLKTFYEKLLGWKIDVKSMPDYGLVSTGSKDGINGGLYQCERGQKPTVTFYAQVKNLADTLAKAKKLGGRVVMPPMEIPDAGISIAMFRDPEGNVIGIMK